MADATPSPVISKYITMVFGTSGWSPKILDVTMPDLSREFVEIPHQTTTGHMPKRRKPLADLGEWGFTGMYSPDEDIPIDGGSEQVIITVGSGGATVTFYTAMSGYSSTGTYGELMTFAATFMVLGQISCYNGSTTITIG